MSFSSIKQRMIFLLAECFLGAVSHIQETISFLESIVQRVHATSRENVIITNEVTTVFFLSPTRQKGDLKRNSASVSFSPASHQTSAACRILTPLPVKQDEKEETQDISVKIALQFSATAASADPFDGETEPPRGKSVSR